MDDIPMLMTKSAYYNFLREHWLCNEMEESNETPLETLQSAAQEWQRLKPEQRETFKEGPYVGTRLALDLFDCDMPRRRTKTMARGMRGCKVAKSRTSRKMRAKSCKPIKAKSKSRSKRMACKPKPRSRPARARSAPRCKPAPKNCW